MHVDVCIASYRRPGQLRDLLQSLFGLETGGTFTYAVHVADNDRARSAEPVVRELERAGHRISYGVEPVQNISLARNLSLRFATGDWIATIDDDTTADPRWLLDLLEAALAHRADAVFGPHVLVVPHGTPRYLTELLSFPDPPTGSERGFVPATSSLLFRRSLIEGQAEPFDPRFGRTGGEDTDFARRLRERGCRVIWCREAKVIAPVAPDRATLRYVLRRRFRTGNTDLRKPLPVSVAIHLQSIVILAVTSAAHAVAGIVRPSSRLKAQVRFVRLLGHLAFIAGRIAGAANYTHEEYRG